MTKYVEKKVFQDPAVNAIIDRMYYELMRGLPSIEALPFKIPLTGRAAYIHQNETPPAPCNNIVFITPLSEIYEFVQKELPRVWPNNGVTLFKERTLFYFDNLFIEIWFEPIADLFAITYNNIQVQRAGAINPILL
ncbi:hypothetical protein ACX0HA_09055 [Flavobacterium hauense]